MGDGVAEQDPFDEFLSQEQAAQVHPAAYAEHPQAVAQEDPNLALRQLVECGQRQEQLLGKVCSLLVGLDEKIGRLTVSQERLESSIQQLASQGPGLAPASSPAGAGSQRPTPARGNLVQPPGKSGPVNSAAAGGSFAGGAASGGSFAGAASMPSPEANVTSTDMEDSPGPEEQRLAAERLAAERVRMEEEYRRREEELMRKREEEERRKREEAERVRLEEERRKEEERQRKAKLEKKTGSLMNNLISGGGGSSLFGDDEPKRGSKGGLFDD